MRTMLILPLAAALAGGCTSTASNAPSLLPRPIENRSDAVAQHPLPEVKPDPQLDAKIADLSAQVDQAVAAFDPVAEAADQAVRAGQGAEIGSDRWIAAQSALSELDAMRTAILTPLVALEDLAIARANDGQPPYPALETALDKAETADAAQAERLAALDRQLPQ